MTQDVVIAFAAFFSIFTPLVFVAIRESVKFQRQETIRDLQTVFAPIENEESLLIPSFEFVKYKYFFSRKNANGDEEEPKDYKLLSWIISSIPLIIILFFMNDFVFFSLMHSAFGMSFDAGIAWLKTDTSIPVFAWVLIASYAGGYLFMLRSFFTAINNFDLSPFSFVGAFINLLSGLNLSLIFVFGLVRATDLIPGWNTDPPNPAVLAVYILSGFAVGYWPAIATRNLLRASKLQDYKKENVAIYNSFNATPVEIVDGIDTEARERLADFHIQAVQNLAAANPLMLFVETPYGVYQILDWVAQAQLCCSVGPAVLLELWKLGIRTIFDLERAALEPACRDNAIVGMIGAALFSDVEKAKHLSTEAIIVSIRLRLNDSHIHRLRQIYNRIGEKLGDDSRRLPPLRDCPLNMNPACPFAKPKPLNPDQDGNTRTSVVPAPVVALERTI